MLLERLTVKRFKGLIDLQLDFQKGINVIKGLNEAGKSTITQALLTVLFGNAKSSSAGVAEAKSWTGDTLFRCELLFSHDDHKYQLIRDFEAKQQELTDFSTGEKWVDKKRIDERMADIIGFTKEAVFSATAVMQQEELAKLRTARDEISNLLEAKVSGSGYVDVRHVIKQLKARVAVLKKSGAKDPGLIAMEKSKLQDLEIRRHDIVQDLTDFDEAIKGKGYCEELIPLKQKELASKKKALAGAARFKQRHQQLKQEEKNLQDSQNQLKELQRYSKEMAETKRALEQCKGQLVEVEKNLNNQKEIQALYKQDKQLADEIKAKQKKLEQINQAKQDIERLNQQLAVTATIDEKTVNLVKKLQNDHQIYTGWKKRQGFRIQINPEKQLQIATTCDDEPVEMHNNSGGFTVDAQSRAEMIIPGVVNVTVENKDLSAQDNSTLLRETTLKLQHILAQNNCQSAEELLDKFSQGQASARQKQVAEQLYIGFLQGRILADYVAELEQSVEQQEKVREQISKLQVQHMDETAFQHLKTTAEQLRAQLEGLNAKYNQLVGAIEALPAVEEIEKRCQQHFNAIRIAQDALEEAKPFACTPEEYVMMEEALKECEKEVSALEARLVFYQRTLDQQKYGEEDLARVEERIEDTKRRISGLARQLKVLEFILVGLSEARSKTVETISRIITDEVGQQIDHITGGKYTKVRRKEGELAFEIFSPVKKDWLDSEYELSTGTRDQLYLTARLAVLKAISGRENLPVILDETLVTFDSERRQQTLDLFRKRIKNQFIVTTCHDHYDIAADHIISL